MKYINKITFLIALFFLATACEDALDRVPLDAPSDETFFSNESELILALNGAYRSLYWRTGGVPFPMALDNATDLGFLRSNFGSMQTYSRGAHSSQDGGFADTWENMYTGISRVNNLLNNMDRAEGEVSEEASNRITAEAYFLRSFFYFWLTELYGDVPYVTELPATIAEAEVPRTPKSEVVSNILNDLDYAIQHLPDSWGGSDEGRATKGAALTLKSRIALMNEMWDTAAEAANQVMEMDMYSLYPDYEALFTYEGERSAEVIFDMPFLVGFIDTTIPREQGPRNTSSWSRFVPSQFILDSYEAVDGLPIDESPLYDPAHPFENRDPRLDASIIRPQTLFATYVFETHPDSVETWQIVDGDAKRVANQDVLNPFATFTGYLWKKYTSPSDLPQNRSNSQLNFILMRYAEVLLNYAEAKIEANEIDQSVLDAINNVRARAYGVNLEDTDQYPEITATDQDELRQIIRRERKIELADEGFRMLDIHRWKIAEHVMPGTLVGRPKGAFILMDNVPEINEFGHPEYGAAQDLYRSVDQRIFDPSKDYLWPIPQKDLDVNEQLTQNPGY